MKILIIAPRFPYPIEKGDKLRLYHQIRVLSKYHKIYLFAISDVNIQAKDKVHLKQFVEEIRVFRITKPGILASNAFKIFSQLPFQVLYFYNDKIRKELVKFYNGVEPDVIYNQLIRTTEYSRNIDCFKVLDYMDAFSSGMEKRLDNSSFPFSWLYREERRRLKLYEKNIYKDFDQHSIISEQDKKRLIGGKIKDIHVVPNGVDTNYFQPKDKEKEYDLCFVGNMGYRPNILAAEYLVNEIVPLLVKEKRDIKVLLAGARPHKRVKVLESKNVHVSGWMEDIRDAYASSHIFVAPIFTGIGQQNKVLEAMSMGMACICTDSVNNPIGSHDNEEVLVANNAEEFSRSVFLLLKDKELRTELGIKSRKMVLETYSWDTQVKILIELFEKNYDRK